MSERDSSKRQQSEGDGLLLSVACFHSAVCLLSAACCLLPTACSLLPDVCCLLPYVCCLLSVVCCLLPAAVFLLYVVWCLLAVSCCLLPAVYCCCLLSSVCCLPSVVGCQLSESLSEKEREKFTAEFHKTWVSDTVWEWVSDRATSWDASASKYQTTAVENVCRIWLDLVGVGHGSPTQLGKPFRYSHAD